LQLRGNNYNCNPFQKKKKKNYNRNYLYTAIGDGRGLSKMVMLAGDCRMWLTEKKWREEEGKG
jgi:hypothetical protein